MSADVFAGQSCSLFFHDRLTLSQAHEKDEDFNEADDTIAHARDLLQMLSEKGVPDKEDEDNLALDHDDDDESDWESDDNDDETTQTKDVVMS